jgi:hypothetical protein
MHNQIESSKYCVRICLCSEHTCLDLIAQYNSIHIARRFQRFDPRNPQNLSETPEVLRGILGSDFHVANALRGLRRNPERSQVHEHLRPQMRQGTKS